jgi:hypothetical protein
MIQSEETSLENIILENLNAVILVSAANYHVNTVDIQRLRHLEEDCFVVRPNLARGHSTASSSVLSYIPWDLGTRI